MRFSRMGISRIKIWSTFDNFCIKNPNINDSEQRFDDSEQMISDFRTKTQFRQIHQISLDDKSFPPLSNLIYYITKARQFLRTFEKNQPFT